MAIAPDDLLIFKIREAEGHGSANAKPLKQAQTKAPEQRLEQAQPARQETAEVQRQAQRVEEPEREFVAPQGSYEQVEEALESTGVDMNAYMGKGRRETRAQLASKEAASGLSCAWHPWRPAYAVCSYCHRPFCFEDIVEYNGRYYCLEDIDEVSKSAAPSETVGYSASSFVAGAFLALAFVAFLYFANGQLAYIINYANNVGFFAFLGHMQFEYAFALLGMLVTFFELVAGIMVFGQAKSGFAVSLAMSMAGIVLFSYQYLSSSTFYALILAALNFLAMGSLILSTRTMRFMEVDELRPKLAEAVPTEFPNAGRF